MKKFLILTFTFVMASSLIACSYDSISDDPIPEAPPNNALKENSSTEEETAIEIETRTETRNE